MAKRLTTAQLTAEIESLRARLETSQQLCAQLQAQVATCSAMTQQLRKHWEPGAERKALVAKYHELVAQGKRAVIRGNAVITY